MAGARVLVAGDVMLDRYVVGEVSRISPEAPVPILKYSRSWEAPGGAANVASNVRALGGDPLLLAHTGADVAGARLKELLAASGIGTDHIYEDPGYLTPVKTRFLSGSHHLLRVDEEQWWPCNAAMARQLRAGWRKLMKRVPVAVYSDYDKGTASAFARDFVDDAKRADVKVVVDPKPQNAARFQGAFLMTPNLKEASRMSGVDLKSDAQFDAAGPGLLRNFRCEAMVITRGADGMTLIQKKKPAQHFAATRHEVYDVTGAGDTVAATLGLALAAGFELAESVRLANVAAGIVVQKAGTAAPSREELESAANRRLAKVLTPEDLDARLREFRHRGAKIVFTNGVFDLLHPGHVRYLREAKALGHVLVVGLNSDSSARKLKGAGRPVQSEAARAEVLAALDAVDFVVLFDEETPLKLIRRVRPDLLVKGGDYTPETVVGRDYVESYGGQVRILPYRDGYSTSRLLEKIRKPG